MSLDRHSRIISAAIVWGVDNEINIKHANPDILLTTPKDIIKYFL